MKLISGTKHYTLTDLTKATGLSYITIWRMAKDKQIALVTFGKRRYITEAEFNRIVFPQ